jgi:single-stranded-DNA-specific exonuclease
MLKKGLLGKRLDTKSITWQLSPVLNSTGRMGEPDKAVELLLAEDGQTAEDLVSYISGLNNRRKKVEERIWDRIQSKARESHEKTSGRFVYVVDDVVERGVTGILAARLSRLFRVPALVAARIEDRIVGSLRSPRTVHLKRFLDGFSDLLSDYGGHDFAAGFNMPLENLAEFESRFYQKAVALVSEAEEEDALVIDAEIPVRMLDPDLYGVSALFEPFGESNPPLTFVTRGMRVLSYEAVGKKGAVHLKLLLGCGQRKWPAIWWNAADRAGRDFQLDDNVDVAYRLSRSEWRGHESLQLTVLDVQR